MANDFNNNYSDVLNLGNWSWMTSEQQAEEMLQVDKRRALAAAEREMSRKNNIYGVVHYSKKINVAKNDVVKDVQKNTFKKIVFGIRNRIQSTR